MAVPITNTVNGEITNSIDLILSAGQNKIRRIFWPGKLQRIHGDADHRVQFRILFSVTP
jgi:prephenate dehydratase